MALFGRGAARFRTWRPRAGAPCHFTVLPTCCPGLDLVLSADSGWVFDFLFGETEEMSKYVKTFEWPLPKDSKKLQKAPQTLVKCSLELREGLDFLPPGDFSPFRASLEETTGMWKSFLQ